LTLIYVKSDGKKLILISLSIVKTCHNLLIIFFHSVIVVKDNLM